MAKLARFIVSPELLVDAMHMPDGTKIHRVYQDPRIINGCFEFIVENDDFKDEPEGTVITRVEPIITTHYHETVDGKEVITYSWEWGDEWQT